MRRSGLICVAAVAACLGAGSAVAAPLSGTLRTTIAETLPHAGDADGAHRSVRTLQGPGGERTVVPANTQVADELDALSGRAVTLTTDSAGRVTEVRPIASTHAADAPGPMRLLTVMMTPAGETPGITNAELRTRLFDDSGSVAAYFAAQRPGFSMTGTVIGPYPVPAVSGCDASVFDSQVEGLAAAAGVNRADYTHVMVYFPDQLDYCAWAGLAQVRGPKSYVNGSAGRRTLAHELGHNLGLYHAQSVSCRSGAGAAVTFETAASCSFLEYGDPFSTMGASRGTTTPGALWSVQDREGLAWLPATGFYGQAGPATLPPVDPAQGASQRVEFPIDPGVYASVEYRTSGGFDSILSPLLGGGGVTVYVRGDASPLKPGTFVVDAAPATSTVDDSALAVGIPVSLGTRGASVVLEGSDASGARVRITPMADSSPPSAPGGLRTRYVSPSELALTWSAASDDIGVADYRVLDNGAVIATVTSTEYTITNATAGVHDYTVVARDYNRNESAPSAPARAVVGAAPSFTGPLTLRRTGDRRVDVVVPKVDDFAGLARLELLRNGQLMAIASYPDGAAPPTMVDQNAPARAEYTVVAISRSGMSARVSGQIGAPARGTPTTPGASPTSPLASLSGRLRLRCGRFLCILTADRGTADVSAITLQVRGRKVGARAGRLAVRVPRAMLPRLRTVTVTTVARNGATPARYAVRLPRPTRLGDVVSGTLRRT